MPSQIAQARSQDLILGHNDTAECQKVSTDVVGKVFRRVFGETSASLPLDETIDYFQAQAILHRGAHGR